MEDVTVVLSRQDVNTIFEALVDHSPDVSDSSLTDLFCALTKIGKEVVVSTVEEEAGDISQRIVGLTETIANTLLEVQEEEAWNTSNMSDEESWDASEDVWTIDD
jgi:hypothetical protein